MEMRDLKREIGEYERWGDMTLYKETQGHITFKDMSDLIVKRGRAVV